MATLKSDLDSYLLQNENRRSFKISLPFSTPSFLSRSNDETPSSSSSAGTWFEEVQKEYCTLSRTQRFMGFGVCLGFGILCFILSFLYIPILLLQARKFALLFTLGSLFFIFSFSFLYGPWNHLKSMFSKERALTTSLYGFTLIATLYCALHLRSTPWTIVCAVAQVVALLWMMMGSIPGGSTGARGGINVQRVRPVVPNEAAARRPPAEKTAFRVQRVRQPVPLADGAGAPQGGVPALERLLLLLPLRVRRKRRRDLPRGPPQTAIMPPSHYCRGQASQAGHFCMNVSILLF